MVSGTFFSWSFFLFFAVTCNQLIRITGLGGRTILKSCRFHQQRRTTVIFPNILTEWPKFSTTTTTTTTAVIITTPRYAHIINSNNNNIGLKLPINCEDPMWISKEIHMELHLNSSHLTLQTETGETCSECFEREWASQWVSEWGLQIKSNEWKKKI